MSEIYDSTSSNFQTVVIVRRKVLPGELIFAIFFNPAHQQLFVILAMCIAWERKKDNTVVGREA